MSQEYGQVNKDLQLENERMDESFASLSANDKKALKNLLRDLPNDRKYSGAPPLTGLGHYGFLEILNKLALFDSAIETTGNGSPDMRRRDIVRHTVQDLEDDGQEN